MAYADVSLASTSVSNPVFDAASSFVLGSPWASTGGNDLSSRSSASATAALGSADSQTSVPAGPSSSVATPAPVAAADTILGLPKTTFYIAAAVGGVGLLAAVWFIARK